MSAAPAAAVVVVPAVADLPALAQVVARRVQLARLRLLLLARACLPVPAVAAPAVLALLVLAALPVLEHLVVGRAVPVQLLSSRSSSAAMGRNTT